MLVLFSEELSWLSNRIALVFSSGAFLGFYNLSERRKDAYPKGMRARREGVHMQNRRQPSAVSRPEILQDGGNARC